MKNIKSILAIISTTALFASCRPKPIDINVPQAEQEITVSSVAYDAHTAFVSVGYSISSCVNLEDTTGDNVNKVKKDLLIDDALVTITEAGQLPDTLVKVSAGLYGSRKLDLKPDVDYTIFVKDNKKNKVVTATTRFFKKPDIESLVPEVLTNIKDTVIKLHLKLNNVDEDSKFFVSYTTTTKMRQSSTPLTKGITSLHSFSPKCLELISADGVKDGVLSKTIVLQIAVDDTLVVQTGRIDNGYFKYLDAYKRCGYLIDQLTGEPINLPTNITAGLGYFTLSQMERRTYKLR